MGDYKEDFFMIARLVEFLKRLCAGITMPVINSLRAENYILGEEAKSKKFD